VSWPAFTTGDAETGKVVGGPAKRSHDAIGTIGPQASYCNAHVVWICARLGGWTGYGGKPEPIVLVRGLVRLQAMLEGIKRFALMCIP